MSHNPSTASSSFSIPEDTPITDDTVSSTTVTTTTTGTTTTSATTPSIDNPSSSITKSEEAAIRSLSSILPSLPSASHRTPTSLLRNLRICSQISSLLRQPDSGAGDNHLCRWFYDTFQSSDPDLQLLVLRFLPAIAGLYLSRVPLRLPLAGFEAVLLALYAHETTSRAGHSITVNVPDISHPSLYHESMHNTNSNNNSTFLNLTVISSTLEPHGTVRSTRRARIVGVALELYYSKVYNMPVESKIDFCEFCKVWAGVDGEMYKLEEEEEGHGEEGSFGNKNKDGAGGVPLPSELLQPVLRILGHCLLCPNQNKKVVDKAREACRCLYARSMHDINPQAILATGSLLNLAKMSLDSKNDHFDPTDIPKSRVITL